MKQFLCLFIAVIFIVFAVYKNEETRKQELVDGMTKMCEVAYFEGQKDAISGDIRIELKNGEYEWIKSPWDNDTKESGWAKHFSEVKEN